VVGDRDDAVVADLRVERRTKRGGRVSIDRLDLEIAPQSRQVEI